MKRKRRAGPGILLFFFLTAAAALPAYGAAGAEEGAAVKTGAGYAGEEASEEDELTLEIDDSLMSEMDMEEIQQAVDELLGKDDFSVSDSVLRLMSGEDIFAGTDMAGNVLSLVTEAFSGQREIWMRILILVLAAALLSNFASLFESSQMGEMGFYMIYLLVFALLLRNFQALSSQLSAALEGILNFMNVLVPAYYIAVATATGASSAAMFYQIVLFVITLVERLLIYLILPGIQIYVLISLVNQLSREDFLSRMAELLKTCISWVMKTALGLVIGMQITRNLISPALDSLRRTIIGKTASAIPGVGNAIDSVTEMVIGSAVLIRNCLGAVALVILFLCGVIPLIQFAVTGLTYRLLAAFTQPVSDKRMVGCLTTMGEGCSLLLKLLLTTEVLFMVTVAILAAGG